MFIPVDVDAQPRFDYQSVINSFNSVEKAELTTEKNEMYAFSQPNVNQMTTKCQPNDNQMSAQNKINESKTNKNKDILSTFWCGVIVGVVATLVTLILIGIATNLKKRK